MGALFSAPAPPVAAQPKQPAPPPAMSANDKAVWELKVTRDKLNRYKTKLDKDRNQYVVRAKTLLKEGKKPEALTLLKMKKYKDKQYLQVEGQMDNINQTLQSVLSAEMTVKVFKSLEQGTQALKRLNEEMPIEKVERLLEETAEAIAYQEEISNLLSQGLTSEDASSVEDELQSMLNDINPSPQLPVAPQGPLVSSPAATAKAERTLVAS